MRREPPKLGTAEVLHGNALDLPLEDESVDLIISSPPYFSLRSYQDEGEHYEGQIGSEETPEQFLEALWAVMAECQPPGTMVKVVTQAGSLGHPRETVDRPIEQVRAGDAVVSYNMAQGYLHTNGKRVAQASSRPYCGDLVTVKAGGSLSRYTKEHHCVVRLADVPAGKHAVYIMRRGPFYRVGHTTMRPAKNRAWGPRRRAAAEGADAVWVLALYDTVEEAAVAEATVAYTYGIPMAAFLARTSRIGSFATHSQEVLDGFWLGMGELSEKASACLAAFGRDIRYPLWSSEAESKPAGLGHRDPNNTLLLVTKPTVIRACNLLDGMGVLKVESETLAHSWEPITVGREHYSGPVYSLGVEDDHTYLADNVITHNCWRVLKPTGSCWINLGDKYAGSGSGSDNGTLSTTSMSNPSKSGTTKRGPAPKVGIRTKSLMAMPWRFAIGCIDGKAAPDAQQWILRAEVIWSKPNGLPESVTDRVRRSHEQWFHFTKQGKYFTGIDEIREPHNVETIARRERGRDHRYEPPGQTFHTGLENELNPLGKLPGSVWSVPSEPLKVPEELGIDHFAAFPTEWPRKIILGWSPSGVCVECGEGRRPVVEKSAEGRVEDPGGWSEASAYFPTENRQPINKSSFQRDVTRTITNYSCACPDPTSETRPAVVLDPFGGTGTTAMVAKALGRHGISVDLSKDYCRLAEWRTTDPQEIRDVQAKTYGIKREIPQQIEGQAALFGDD